MKNHSCEISTVHVDLQERSYDILAGDGILAQAPELLDGLVKGRQVFILSDETVASLYSKTLAQSLQEQSEAASVSLMSVTPGEGSKSFAVLEDVLSWLLMNGADRQSLLIAVGGGVVGDLGGFAASITMRGIDYIQVPTSLLAQVDSAVGGKTAINMPFGKNLVGAFYQPRAVLCDFETLSTLPPRQIKAGYAEIVKYGLISDASFFIWLESHGKNVCALETNALEKAVTTSCRKKAEIVAADEREKDARAMLNFGHTFAHALEAASGYDGRVLHGEAVSIGMVCAVMLSYRLGFCDEKDIERLVSHLKEVGLPVSISQISPALDVSAEALYQLMKGDKKAVDGQLAFILLREIGEAFVERGIEKADVIKVLNQSLSGDIC